MSAFQKFLISEAVNQGLDEMVGRELAKGYTTPGEIVDALGGGPYTVELVGESLARLGRA